MLRTLWEYVAESLRHCPCAAPAGAPVSGGTVQEMSLRWQCTVVDSVDPVSLARWWAELLGWRITFEEADESVLEPPEGSPEDGVSPDILFIRVPETKQVKNRLHFDLRPEDQATEVTRAKALGARRIDVGQTDEVTWVVMADPEGNEFCILRALEPDDMPEA